MQKALDLFDNLESQMANVPSFDLVADGMAHDMLLIIRHGLGRNKRKEKEPVSPAEKRGFGFLFYASFLLSVFARIAWVSSTS